MLKESTHAMSLNAAHALILVNRGFLRNLTRFYLLTLLTYRLRHNLTELAESIDDIFPTHHVQPVPCPAPLAPWTVRTANLTICPSVCHTGDHAKRLKLVDPGDVEFGRLTESNFYGVEVVDCPVTPLWNVFLAPPPSHLMSSFSTQSLNFVVI